MEMGAEQLMCALISLPHDPKTCVQSLLNILGLGVCLPISHQHSITLYLIIDQLCIRSSYLAGYPLVSACVVDNIYISSMLVSAQAYEKNNSLSKIFLALENNHRKLVTWCSNDFKQWVCEQSYFYPNTE